MIILAQFDSLSLPRKSKIIQWPQWQPHDFDQNGRSTRFIFTIQTDMVCGDSGDIFPESYIGKLPTHPKSKLYRLTSMDHRFLKSNLK